MSKLEAYLDNPSSDLSKELYLELANTAMRLSLPELSYKIYDKVIDKIDQNDKEEKANVLLKQAIISFQEEDPKLAIVISKEVTSLLGKSTLRNYAYLLIAESLEEQDKFSEAKDYYSKALREAKGLQIEEISIRLAKNLIKQSMYKEARELILNVSTGSKFSEEAIKVLIEIDWNLGSYKQLINWVERLNLEQFNFVEDKKILFYQICSYNFNGDKKKAQKLLLTLKQKVDASDPWMVLLKGASLFPDICV